MCNAIMKWAEVYVSWLCHTKHLNTTLLGWIFACFFGLVGFGSVWLIEIENMIVFLLNVNYQNITYTLYWISKCLWDIKNRNNYGITWAWTFDGDEWCFPNLFSISFFFVWLLLLLFSIWHSVSCSSHGYNFVFIFLNFLLYLLPLHFQTHLQWQIIYLIRMNTIKTHIFISFMCTFEQTNEKKKLCVHTETLDKCSQNDEKCSNFFFCFSQT